MTLVFFAEGIPQPQGSAKGFVVRSKATGKLRAVVTSDNAKLRPWRESVRDAARRALAAAGLEGRLLAPSGVVRLDVTFLVPAPQWATKKLLKGKAVECETGRDADKLLRGIFDALSGLVYTDDKQAGRGSWDRRYQHPAKPPGVHVVVTVADQAPLLGRAAGREG